MRKIHQVAVLLADKDLPALYHNQQTLPILFTKFFDKKHYQITFFDILALEYPKAPSQYDACIISGSKHSVLNQEPWAEKLYNFVLDKEYKKLIGICYGHQMIALALGGKVQQADWHIGVSKVHYLNNNNKTPDFYARFNHQDQVVRLPKDAKLLASSEPCANTLFQINDKILSMQFHPEFTQPYHSKLLYQRYAQKLNTEALERAKKTLNLTDSKLAIADLIQNFITAL